MSTTVTSANGVVVITQVFPKDEDGKISLLPTPNLTLTLQEATPTEGVKVSEMTKMFLRGEPQSLGIVQILLGFLFIAASLMGLLPSLILQAPLFMGAAFILSGSLAVAAREGTRPGLIRGTLAVSVLSVLVALAGVGYLCTLLALQSNTNLCGPDAGSYNSSEPHKQQCFWMSYRLKRVLGGLNGLYLVLTVLELCVVLTVCVFSGKALCRRDNCSRHTVAVVETGSSPVTNHGCPSGSDSKEGLLGKPADDPVCTPPPYSL